MGQKRRRHRMPRPFEPAFQKDGPMDRAKKTYEKTKALVEKDEFRNCRTSGCPNIVSVSSGQVHCLLHREETS